MRRVMICGDRNWTNYARILACVQKAHTTTPIDVVIEGECRGADKMGRRAAEAIGLSVEAGSILTFPAQWDKYPNGAAGPIRNQQQLDEGKPTEVWAFHNNLETSIGTKDMVNRALRAGLDVYVITETGWTLRATTRERPLFAPQQWQVVNTDNFGSDYPNEKFVGEPYESKQAAEDEAKRLNGPFPDYATRYHKVVQLPYTLKPGFEP